MSTHLIVPRALRRAPLTSRRFAAPGLFTDFDRFFDAFLGGESAPVSRDGAPVFAPPLDYSETDTEIRVAAELPGIEEKDITVSLEEGVLTIEGERVEAQREEDEKGFRRVESARGHFRRAVRLNAEVDEEAVSARYRNGVLTVTLPKVAEAGPQVRTIPVTTS